MSYWDGSRWATDAPPATNSSRPVRLLLGAAAEAGLISLLLVGLIAGTTFAGKGGGKPGGGKPTGGSSTVSLVVVSSPIDDGLPHYDGQVTFNVVTPTEKPMVSVSCLQGGVSVYRASAGFFPDYPWQWAQVFSLRSMAWTGGAADCTATLYYVNARGNQVTLGSTGFFAAA